MLSIKPTGRAFKNFVLLVGSEATSTARGCSIVPGPALGASILGRFPSGNGPSLTAVAYLRTADSESRCAVPHASDLLKPPRFSYRDTIPATPRWEKADGAA